jgi:hypothetical protein
MVRSGLFTRSATLVDAKEPCTGGTRILLVSGENMCGKKEIWFGETQRKSLQTEDTCCKRNIYVTQKSILGKAIIAVKDKAWKDLCAEVDDDIWGHR